MSFVRQLSAVLLLAAAATGAQASTVFSQNFSGGLGANESVSGLFTVDGGTVGHSGFYADDEYSYYGLTLNLTNVTGATLSFDIAANMEGHYDRFNVLASTGVFAPPTGLIFSDDASFYTDEGDLHRGELGSIALARDYTGSQNFDLTAFDGQVVNLRFQFGSDGSVTSSGVNIDNILVSGVVASVPEPGSWALMIGGFGMVGGAVRRRRAGFATGC